jgi:hypothetical protein
MVDDEALREGIFPHLRPFKITVLGVETLY